MKRRMFLQILPGIWLALQPTVAGAAELTVGHLRIEGMT